MTWRPRSAHRRDKVLATIRTMMDEGKQFVTMREVSMRMTGRGWTSDLMNDMYALEKRGLLCRMQISMTGNVGWFAAPDPSTEVVEAIWDLPAQQREKEK